MTDAEFVVQACIAQLSKPNPHHPTAPVGPHGILNDAKYMADLLVQQGYLTDDAGIPCPHCVEKDRQLAEAQREHSKALDLLKQVDVHTYPSDTKFLESVLDERNALRKQLAEAREWRDCVITELTKALCREGEE